ncbi:MAG: hypothetical protein ACT452_02460 [Microthrixaceae bacterium]
MDDATAIAAATTLIESLAPRGAPVPIRTPLLADECRWFLRSVQAGVVEFDACTAACFRFKKWGSGPDHFLTPAGKPRHLFSKPDDQQAWLNREYVPHIAAYAKAILHHGYDRDRSSFSRYRAFSRDLIVKKAGGNYETDAEFYGHDETLLLQIEAKASERQTQALARAIETHGSLRDLPTAAAKEIEYVLDLAPRVLWIVGPGSVDPARFVYEVHLDGPLNARFERIEDLPAP